MDETKVNPVREGLHSLTLLYFPDFIFLFFFVLVDIRKQEFHTYSLSHS